MGYAGVLPLQMKGLLLPVFPEELLWAHRLDETLKQTSRAEKAQRTLDTVLFSGNLLLSTTPPLYGNSSAFLWHCDLKETKRISANGANICTSVVEAFSLLEQPQALSYKSMKKFSSRGEQPTLHMTRVLWCNMILNVRCMLSLYIGGMASIMC